MTFLVRRQAPLAIQRWPPGAAGSATPLEKLATICDNLGFSMGCGPPLRRPRPGLRFAGEQQYMFKNLNVAVLGLAGHQSEVIELALTFGFQGLDINISEFATRVKLHGAAYARRLTDSAKLKLGSFELPLDWEADDAAFQQQLQTLAEYAAVAGQVGCHRGVTVLPPGSNQRPYHENFEFFRRRLADAARTLAVADVQLAVGFRAAEAARHGFTYQFIHDIEALSMLVSMVPQPNVGLLLDIWELHVSGAAMDRIRTLPVQQIVTVDVANLPAAIPAGAVTDEARLLPMADDGAIDVPAALAILAEIGYRGPVTPKPARSQFKDLRRDAAIRLLSESFNQAWKAANLSPAGKLLAVTQR